MTTHMTDRDDNGEGVRWLTYAELGQAREISTASATRLAFRRKWQRRVGNSGTAKVAVPVEDCRPHKSTDPDVMDGPDDDLDDRPIRVTGDSLGDAHGLTGVVRGQLLLLVQAVERTVAGLRSELSTQVTLADAVTARLELAEQAFASERKRVEHAEEAHDVERSRAHRAEQNAIAERKRAVEAEAGAAVERSRAAAADKAQMVEFTRANTAEQALGAERQRASNAEAKLGLLRQKSADAEQEAQMALTRAYKAKTDAMAEANALKAAEQHRLALGLFGRLKWMLRAS
jgi:hypothetical protein